jgi:alanine racemase
VDTRIAVLPMGYSDGYPRLLSSRAHALVSGQRCPVLGRVMMNHVVIDVTRAARGEGSVTATLLGRDGDEQVSADQLAVWAQTINYEIVTRIGAHLRRVVI